MWIFVSAIVNIILQLNVVHSHSPQYFYNEYTGPIDLHTNIGTLPVKYQVLDGNDLNASRKVATVVELLRPLFPPGFGPMPPLDPYKKKDFKPIAFNIPNLWLSGKVYMKNLTVTGAQHFSFESFQLRLKSSRSDAVLKVPHLVGEVDSEVRANFGLLPIVFGGHLRIVITGMTVAGAVGASKTRTSDNRQVFQLTSADVNGHVQNLQIEVTNFHSGDGLEDFGKDFSINMWINELKDDIALAIVRRTMDEINSMLRTYTVDQIMRFLLS